MADVVLSASVERSFGRISFVESSLLCHGHLLSVNRQSRRDPTYRFGANFWPVLKLDFETFAFSISYLRDLPLLLLPESIHLLGGNHT